MIEQGRFGEAIRSAYALRAKFDAAASRRTKVQPTISPWPTSPSDVRFRWAEMRRPPSRYLESAHRRFVELNEPRMAAGALTERADCLSDLGRYDEAAEAYQQTIAIAEKQNDPRSVAVNKFQLADRPVPPEQTSRGPQALRRSTRVVRTTERTGHGRNSVASGSGWCIKDPVNTMPPKSPIRSRSESRSRQGIAVGRHRL